MNEKALEDCLINFSLKKCAASGEILNTLLKKYTDILKIRDNYRFTYVLENLENYSLFTNEYKLFLKKASEIYLKRINDISLDNHSDLLQ